jgi:TPR repeat protein
LIWILIGIKAKTNSKYNRYNSSALTILSVKSFKSGDFEQAHKHLLTALKIDTNRAGTLLNLGRLYKTLNWDGYNLNRAFEMFQKASDAGSVEAKTELGNCYQEG